MRGLRGKVALVTGGSSGLGNAIAIRLAADGAHVVITDVQVDLGEASADEHGLTFAQQDVCDEAGWPKAVEMVEARFGALHILVNNAGVLGPKDAVTPETTRLSDWRKVFAVNVEGTFLGCRAAIPAMRRAGNGSIVNISSVAGLLATPYSTAYGASKAAIRQLTKSVAQHCAEQRLNVRCNSVHPGNIKTPLLDRANAELAARRGVSVERVMAERTAFTPLGGLTPSQDVAATVAFLASDEASHITGAKLIVDGGIKNCDTFLTSPTSPAVCCPEWDESGTKQ